MAKKNAAKGDMFEAIGCFCWLSLIYSDALHFSDLFRHLKKLALCFAYDFKYLFCVKRESVPF